MSNAWFIKFGPPKRSGIRLICFPHAGGAASYFAPLARALSSAVEVLGVQYPGRQNRRFETPVDNLQHLVDLIVKELPPGPYAFFGHSMGALLAFETTRRLETPPLRLFLSGRSAPFLKPKLSDRVEGGEAGILARLRQLGGTGAALLDDPELREMIMPAIRADYHALANYVWTPGPPVTCPISVLVGDADPVTTPDDAAAWRELSTEGGDLHVFSGGHFYIDAHLDEIAEVVTTALDIPKRG